MKENSSRVQLPLYKTVLLLRMSISLNDNDISPCLCRWRHVLVQRQPSDIGPLHRPIVGLASGAR